MIRQTLSGILAKQIKWLLHVCIALTTLLVLPAQARIIKEVPVFEYFDIESGHRILNASHIFEEEERCLSREVDARESYLDSKRARSKKGWGWKSNVRSEWYQANNATWFEGCGSKCGDWHKQNYVAQCLAETGIKRKTISGDVFVGKCPRWGTCFFTTEYFSLETEEQLKFSHSQDLRNAAAACSRSEREERMKREYTDKLVERDRKGWNSGAERSEWHKLNNPTWIEELGIWGGRWSSQVYVARCFALHGYGMRRIVEVKD